MWIKRREFMALSAGMTAMAATWNATAQTAADSGLVVCMHGITSDGFDFRTTMEGWARAGIRAVEPDLVKAREFEDANGKGSARKLLDDLGQIPYSSTNQLYLDEDGEQRPAAIESLRWKVELAAALGADRMVAPSTASQPHVLADYDRLYANLHQAAEIARGSGISLMLEFTRNSRFVNNLRTSLDVVRTVNHPNLRFMIDLYHLWAGPSKFEDLDLVKVGEIHHVHFADTPRLPVLEVAEQKDRAFPGEGIAPLQRILDKLVEKGYKRALSLELFDAVVRTTDPQQIAAKALQTITPYIKHV
jgi:2-keto-myo-inositol isomerase